MIEKETSITLLITLLINSFFLKSQNIFFVPRVKDKQSSQGNYRALTICQNKPVGASVE